MESRIKCPKTKIATKITQHRKLSYQYYHIDIISEFNYLGVLMSSNGKFLKPRNILLIWEEKHFFKILNKSKSISLIYQYFVQFLIHILIVSCYMAQKWGVTKNKMLKRFI